MHLTLNVLLSLLIQAKRTGKGKIGNGRMLIMLLQVIADSVHPELSAERNMLQLFSDEPVKSRVYQKIDKQLVKFIPTGKPYPFERIRFTKFEQTIGIVQRYGLYLLRMQQCCEELLDPEKTESLIYTILEILRTDAAFSDILYGAQYIPKEMLFGTPAHPKKICPAALLLGLLYQAHQNPYICECTVTLMKAPYLLQFHLVNLSGSYRDRTEALTALLDPDAPVSLEHSICKTAEKMKISADSTEIYPLDLREQNGNKADIPERGHIFLYGQGGSGKTTYLSHMTTGNPCFLLPLFQYKASVIASYQPNISNWILLHILLKYHYQNYFRTYDACAAAEGADTVLRQLHELEKLLSIQPVNGLPDYSLMLDGINETPPDERSPLLDEIEHICKEWRNVRLIVSGRNIPPALLFQRFHPIEVCGITNDALADLLPIHTAHRNLLKTPLFLHIYKSANQEPPLNRAGLTERYINRLIDSVHDKTVLPVLRFLVLYVLPFAANHMAQRQRMFVERADLADAIDRAAGIFVNDERIYQNVLYPQQITKKVAAIGQRQGRAD